jgi:hypothetical protein
MPMGFAAAALHPGVPGVSLASAQGRQELFLLPQERLVKVEAARFRVRCHGVPFANGRVGSNCSARESNRGPVSGPFSRTEARTASGTSR